MGKQQTYPTKWKIVEVERDVIEEIEKVQLLCNTRWDTTKESNEIKPQERSMQNRLCVDKRR